MKVGLHQLSLTDQAWNVPDDCLECGSYRNCIVPWLTGRGDLTASTLFLFEAPGEDEDQNGVILCGRAGKLWDKLAAAAGVDYPKGARYDNVVMCYPHGTPNITTIRLCRTFWVDRIKQMPNLTKVICMGKIALTSVVNEPVKTKLDRYRLQPIQSPEFPGLIFFVTYHPAAALRNPALQQVIVDDIKYALAFNTAGQAAALTAEDKLAELEIGDSVRPWSILGETENRPVLVLDFEHTGGLYGNPMPWAKGGKVGELLLCGYSIGRLTGAARLDHAPLPSQVVDVIRNPNAYFVAFNAHHELAWLYVNFGLWPEGRIFDPMIGYHLLDENYPDKSLEGILKKVFKIEPYKMDFWQGFDPQNINWRTLTAYCTTDVTRTRQLAFWVAMRLQQEGLTKLFDHEMANRATSTWGSIRGVRYHLEAAVKQTTDLVAQEVELEARLREIAGVPGLNASSPDQLLPILQAYDPRVRATDATTLRKMLWRQPDLPFVIKLLGLRRIQSQLKYLKNYEENLYDDGLIHFESHPMSKTGRHRANSPNLQNVMR